MLTLLNIPDIIENKVSITTLRGSQPDLVVSRHFEFDCSPGLEKFVYTPHLIYEEMTALVDGSKIKFKNFIIEKLTANSDGQIIFSCKADDYGFYNQLRDAADNENWLSSQAMALDND